MNGTTIDFLSVREAAEKRRSIRAYEPGPIAREELAEILSVARLAPSAFNVQPWRFVVVETPELKTQLAAAAFNQRQVHSAPAVIVLYTDMQATLDDLDAIVHPGMAPEAREGVKKTIRGMFGAQSEDERETWAQGQGYIALGYLLLAAEARGYQTSPMTGFDPAAVKKLLGLPEHVRIPALVAIGHGAEEGFPAHRHALDDILRVA
ncbi:MAG: nitroreductase family protein [Gemmatimonadetes bacterium]|nr:nitroreductase family protein [Gemmatimonadota bacterium]